MELKVLGTGSLFINTPILTADERRYTQIKQKGRDQKLKTIRVHWRSSAANLSFFLSLIQPQINADTCG